MRPNRLRFRPEAGPLDDLCLPSAPPLLATGTFVTAAGAVGTPRAVSQTTLPVSPEVFQARQTTLFGVTAGPLPPRSLDPAPVSAQGASGQPLPFLRGAAYRPGINAGARGYLR